MEKTRPDIIEKAQALVLKRTIPAPYTTVNDVLNALDKRTLEHPRGLAGVADELSCSRKQLWGWLRGFKVPDNANLAKIAKVLSTPIPQINSGIAVKRGVPIPRRGSFAFRRGQKNGRWAFIGTLKKDDFFEASFADRNVILASAKGYGKKVCTRVMSRDKIGVWVL